MWFDVLTNPKQGKAFHEDRTVLSNFPVDYENTEDWKDIDMIVGVPKPGSVPCC